MVVSESMVLGWRARLATFRKRSHNSVARKIFRFREFQANPFCYICEQRILELADASVDHIYPMVLFAQSFIPLELAYERLQDEANFGLCHKRCNEKKSSKLPCEMERT